LRQEHSYVAMVFDEHGGTAGMITIEDLIEEIFGELQDEFDDETALIAADPEGRVRLRGDVLIVDVNELFGIRLSAETVNTIGGFVTATLGRAPRVGDEVVVGATVLRVEAVNGSAVREVSLIPGPNAELRLPETAGKHP
jgi:putative hemolysin